MKVILSRKGFDSAYGGYPSPILPDGRMLSLPIPYAKTGIRYSSLRFNDTTYYDLMLKLKLKIRAKGKLAMLTENSECHLDPDIRKEVLDRHPDWRPCFGQIGASQGHLHNQRVKEDDLFLFFGWFRAAKKSGVKLKFCGPPIHALFGYLQIGKIDPCDEDYSAPKWMSHPHLSPEMRGERNNTIYIAREHLSWNSHPGAGVFSFRQNLVLTKAGLSRSKWDLPDCFRKAEISLHSERSWKDSYFQSAHIGQEFVIQDNDEVEAWAKELIEVSF